ncbi:MAG: hypothetical protein LRY73_00795 [Bacillus sp. (in: Bacteria)]|nr:hypothetical protein [Bacillus sp. (in: firmicutes)]
MFNYKGGDLIIRLLGISIIFTFLLMSCSNNEEPLSSGPDFQGSFHATDEKTSIVVVDMNMTREDMEFFRYPDEWEVYAVKWNDDTTFLDETGTEIPEAAIGEHDHQIKVWTEERFEKELTDFVTGVDENIEEFYPVYTASQIQLVEMTLEDYLARLVSFEKGDLALTVFLGDELSDDQDAVQEFQSEFNGLLVDSHLSRTIALFMVKGTNEMCNF